MTTPQLVITKAIAELVASDAPFHGEHIEETIIVGMHIAVGLAEDGGSLYQLIHNEIMNVDRENLKAVVQVLSDTYANYTEHNA